MSEIVRGTGGPHVGSSVRRARGDAELTLRQLADAVGVSLGTMSAIENDKVSLSVVRLHQIADVLSVTAARLLTPEAPTTATPPEHGHMGSDDPGRAADWRTFPTLALNPVLTAAVEVFTETGYHGATMRLIASHADVSVAGIYHHYPSKQSLLVALIDLVLQDLSWRIRAAGAGQEPVERFGGMVEALTLFHAERGNVAFIVATETRSLEEPDRRRIAESRRAIQEQLQQAAVDGVRSGAFASESPHHTARAIATMCMALPYWYSPLGPQSPQEIATEYVALSLDMMRCSPRGAQGA